MRMSVDLPAPFGPSSPYMPVGMVRVTSFSAWTPLGYVLEMPRMSSCMCSADRASGVGRPHRGSDRSERPDDVRWSREDASEVRGDQCGVSLRYRQVLCVAK